MRNLPPNPTKLELKKHLAWLITARYHGEDEADRVANEWDRRAKGEDPTDVPEVELSVDMLDEEGRIALPNLLVAIGMESSTSKARAVIKQGGVTIGPGREKTTDPNTMFVFQDAAAVRANRLKETEDE